MRVESSLVCVTDSTVYELLKITEVPANVRVAPMLAFKDGVPSLPCHLSEFDSSGDVRKLVASYPKAGNASSLYVLGAFDETGTLLDRREMKVGFKMASLASKMHRRLRPEACAAVERADQRSKESFGPSLDPLLAVSAASHLILKCCLTLPDLSHHGDVSIVTTSDDMSWFTSDFTVLSEKVAPPSAEGAPNLLRMSFSVSVPWDKDGVSLVAYSTRTGEILHVECVSKATRDAMQAYTDRLLYRHAELDPYYDEWYRAHRAKAPELDLQRRYPVPSGPRFTVVVPLGEPASTSIQETILSVINQSYPHWDLVVAASDPDTEGARKALELVESRGEQAKLARLEELWSSLLADNEDGVAGYVCLLNQQDVLEPNALYEFARAIVSNPAIDLLYCDEDMIGVGGAFVQPFFKPDFDWDMLRSTNYLGRSVVVSRRLFDQLELCDCPAFDAAGIYDLLLRAIEKTSRICHVPTVLLHRVEPDASPSEALPTPCPSREELDALKGHLSRLGLSADVSISERNMLRVIYDVPKDSPLVSIVIPSKNNASILRRCVESILDKSTYQNVEVLIVDNGSTEGEVEAFYSSIADERVSVLRHDVPFNFSEIINVGVRNTHGEYLLLLNNDTEVITENWIETMLGICAREDVGAVGVKLLYPDGTMQHAGVNITGGPVHFFSHLPNGARSYHDFAETPRNLSAVTAACMMVRRGVFEEVGGFDEELAVTFNDVDFCLKLRNAGYLVVYNPYVELYHYESISRGADDDLAGRTRSLREKAILLTRWPEPYVLDPYYSPSPRQGNPDGAYYVF